ncbi:MAG: ribosomal-processing cysteine protease Prp [Eubacteriales bacterium]|nr:ribosomal-processing cysteine protease Prp [Eubacteriales bacterium]
MIEITIFKKPDHQFRCITVNGHADSVEEGADLVCCSVSVLTINLVNSLDHLTDDEFSFDQNPELGFISIAFVEEPSEEADLLLKSYELGIYSIAEQYGDWLKVDTEEV